MEKQWKAFNKARREKDLPQVSYSNYMKHYRDKDPVRSKKSLYTETLRRESPKVPSGDMFDRFKPARKKEQVYNGERKLLGISTMHKSNSVPVFSRQDAEDIAKMRRN